MGGGDKATYTVDKFVTKGAGERASAAVSGTITVSGGTLNIDNLSDINKFDLADNSLIVTGKGVLKAASDKVFEADTSGKKLLRVLTKKYCSMAVNWLLVIPVILWQTARYTVRLWERLMTAV